MMPESTGRQTRQASHESEELYRLLAENSTDMISKHTPEGVYTYASPASRSLLGYEPEELVGHSAYEYLHPEDLEQIRSTHSAILQRSGVYPVTYRIRRRDGSYIWLETISRTVRDPRTDEVLEIIAVSRDTTEHKRTEEALRESQEALRKSEEFHRFAVEAGRIGTWDLDLQAEECLISPKMAELMGFSPDQTTVPGPQWRESIIPEDRSLMASALAASIENDAPFDLEFRITLKDGTKRWLYSRGGVTRDASGRALRVHGASHDITERKRAEGELRDSEERLRRAIEIETVGVVFFKTDGSITDANDAFLRMSGYSREDLAQGLVRWDEMTPPEWMPHSLKAIEEFESTGRTNPYEKEYVRKDGSRWCALFAATRLDEEEGVEFIIDITQRKRDQEELERLNLQNESILKSAGEGIVGLDRKGRVTLVNPSGARMLGHEPEELVGRRMHVLAHHTRPDGKPYPEKECQIYAAFEDGSVHHRSDEVFWRKDGTSFPVEYASNPIEVDGEVIGAVVTFRDITERKLAEEALRESEERYRAFFETAAVGASEADLVTGRMLRVNDNLCRFLGYTRDKLLTMTFFQVTHPDDRASNSEGLARLVRGEIREYITEKRYLRGDGGIVWAQLAVALVRDRDGRPLHSVAITQDITERKRAEEAFAEVLRARTEFMADVSHELRTPLTVIRGNAEVGLDLGRESVHGEILEEIVRESGSMSRMVEDLLLLARADSDSLPLDTKMVPVAWLLGRLAGRAEALAREHGTSVQTALSGEGRLRCDAQRIEQAVLILVDNALKHGSPRESIILSSSTRQGELLIEVADRGPGISSEELSRIFERFYRGDGPSEEQGSGLGLAIAKTIAEAHSGKLEAESRVGKGTRMFLHLPLANGS